MDKEKEIVKYGFISALDCMRKNDNQIVMAGTAENDVEGLQKIVEVYFEADKRIDPVWRACCFFSYCMDSNDLDFWIPLAFRIDSDGIKPLDLGRLLEKLGITPSIVAEKIGLFVDEVKAYW